MKIDDGALVSLDVSMYDAQGELLEKSDEPLIYLAGHDDIFPRIEQALLGKSAGDRVLLQLEPDEAFGDYDADLVMLVLADELGDGIVVGMRIEGGAIGSPGHVFTITDIADGMAVLDGNHPLAGIALRFEIEVVDVREATADELALAESPRLPDFLRVADPPEPSDHTLH
jgi:FKBP-type peptidyl-prolyl cis-trans isomerase SlyD